VSTDFTAAELEAIRHEADAMARVSSHPTIVNLHGVGALDDGREFLIMEYCPVTNIADQVRAHPMDVPAALDLIIRISSGVEMLHRMGYVHRDIKPGNIMLDSYQSPVLTDFGVSARIGEPLGETPWMRISQQNINRFGELTDDTQWIHTDPYRAAHTPFGGTIVHGAYLLSLAITFAGQLLPAEGTSMLVNAGVSAARFRSAVPVDSQVCGSASIVSAEDFGDATLAEIRVAVHVKGQSKPATTATVRMVLHD